MTKRIGAWVGLLLLSGCGGGADKAPSPKEAPTMARSETMAKAKATVEVIAHRGASAYAPENTLAAFKMAVEQKADWFELDCTLCKSGEVVVIHDDTLERTTNGKGLVADHDLAALRKLDAGSWKDDAFKGEPVPTLGEALDLAVENGIGVYVEVKGAEGDEPLRKKLLAAAGDATKRTLAVEAGLIEVLQNTKDSANVKLARKVIEDIRNRKAGDVVVVQSFEPVVCAVVALEAKELKCELLVEGEADDARAWERALRWMYVLGLQGLNPGRKLVTQARVASVKEAGRSMAVWTVNDVDEIRRLAKMGVDRLITDKPDLAIDVLKVMQLR